jgi:hypothetical protein
MMLGFCCAAAGPATSAGTTMNANNIKQTFKVCFIFFLLGLLFFPTK